MEDNIITMIPIEDLYQHPDNPRKDLGDLSELTESIRKQGIMQNLTVVPGHRLTDEEWKELAERYKEKPDEKIRELMNSRKSPEGYTVVIGHRRRAAAQAAGITKLPCVIRELDDRKQFEIMMEENMQRQDLTIPEQAYGFQLMFNWGYSAKEIAEKTGFSETTVNHRLQIAKLDKKTLQSRQQDHDNMLQLSLSDLYELEKIKNINDRNRILKEARDSNNLKYLVNDHLEKEARKQNLKECIRILKSMGIEEAPEKVQKAKYSNKYQISDWIPLDKKPGKSLKINGYKKEEKMWYMPVDLKYDRSICILKEASKQDQTKKSKHEIEMKKEESNRKKLKKIKQSMDKDRKAFIKGIIAGDYKDPNRQDIPAIWEMLTEASIGLFTRMYPEIIGEWLTGKQNYRQTQEDKDLISRTELNSMEKVLIMTDQRADEVELMNWNGEYDAYHQAEALILFHEVLKFWGFSVNDEEQIKVLNGTHELYREKRHEQ